ncbi:peptidase S41 [Clostridia bacterium]|nr:peptidase S41 [Clostridia bacterium]
MKIKPFLMGTVFGLILFVFLSSVYTFAIAYARGDLTMEQKLKAIYSLLENKYVGDYEKSRVEDGMYAGLVGAVGDKYTQYLSSKQFKAFQEESNGEYGGIGFLFISDSTRGEYPVTVRAFDGTPAQKAGILPGDWIIKANGVDVKIGSGVAVADILKGPEGTDVSLTIYRPSEDKTIDMTITRENIEVPTVSSKMLDGNIGYIEISSFDGVTLAQFKKAYGDLNDKKMTSLILDVRNNPGGLLMTATQIADILVDTKFTVYTEAKDGSRTYAYAKPDKIEIPLVMLINGNSASSSEVLAGAVKDTKTGVLVGAKTYGKGVVQTLFPLTDGSALKITTAKYYTPNGICVQGEGIIPDYPVDMSDELSIRAGRLPIEEDVQLQKAVSVAKELTMK